MPLRVPERIAREALKMPSTHQAPVASEQPAQLVKEDPIYRIKRVLRETAEEVRTRPNTDLTAALIRLDKIHASATEIGADPKIVSEIKNEIRLVEGQREVQAQIMLFPY
jgi:hypothetical protein